MWRRYSQEKEPEPKPASGRSENRSAPSLTSEARPLVALFAEEVSLRLRCRRPESASATRGRDGEHERNRRDRRARREAHGGDHREAREQRDDARLRDRAEQAEPQHREHAAAASTTRRRLLSHIIAAATSTIVSARKRP